MDVTFQLLVLLSIVLLCNGASIKEQLAHIAQRRLESEGISSIDIKRRYSMPEGSVILGTPSYTAHLPEAEPILPGHTLLRPAVNMLKSAVKFPHLELENGSGVYGSINNLGIRYDGKNERLMYSGFRRSPAESVMDTSKSESEACQKNCQNISTCTDKQKKSQQFYVESKVAKPNPGHNIYVFQISSESVQPRSYLAQKIRLPFVNSPKASKSDAKYLKQLTHKKRQGKKRNATNLSLFSKKYWIQKGLHGRSGPNRRPGQDPNTNRTLTSRIHTSVKTLLFAKKLLGKLYSNRRQRKQNNIIILSPRDKNNEDSGGSQTQQDISTAKEQNKTWFWNSKDVFNHIKFSSDAPEQEDYLPATVIDAEDLRNWWYYHQADFKPFDE